jgi:hypothetical protein
MEPLTQLAAFLLASVGLTVLIVWPQEGPGAWLREHLLRRWLPTSAGSLLDCYICCGFWIGLLLAPLWWAICGQEWCWSGCLMVPGLFWMILRPVD